MKNMVIIRGPLGVGKSTIAQILGKEIKGNYISIDDVLVRNHLDQIDEKEACIPLANFLKANQLIFPQINQAFQEGISVVIDGNFYHKKQIKNLINNFPSESLVFTLTASLEICIQRDLQRPKPYGKDATTAVYNLVSKFDFGQVIDTSTLPIEETVNLIISKINS
jgi:guanylate kinase